MIAFLERYLVPVAARFGSQRHLVAIRDGFAALMPLIIAGSFAVLINNAPIPGYGPLMDSIFSPAWRGVGGSVFWGTIAVLAVLLSFSVAYNLAKSYNSNALNAGLLSMASFVSLLPQVAKVTDAAGAEVVGWGYIGWGFTNAQGMFVAIITALIATELYVRLSKSDKLVVKMPDSVPPAVSKSFAALFPSIIVLTIFGLFNAVFGVITSSDVISIFNKYLGMPLQNMTDSLGALLLIVFLNHILWFFGLHGSNILGAVIEPAMMPLLQTNMDAFNAGQAATHIVTKPFLDCFIYLGGSGATISLLIAIFIAGKRKQNKMIAELGFAPGLFNINEPVIFGLPIVLNPLLIIPFVFGPMVLALISYFALDLGYVPKTIAMVPWTTPPVIGGFIATGSWKGGALAAMNLVVSILIYLPFVVAGEKLEEKRESDSKSAA